MIPRYQDPSKNNNTQKKVSMIPWYQYPSISDTKNRVSMIPWYQYPIRSDTRKKVSKQTMRCWGSCCTTARPVPLTQAQKPLASLIWYHLVYFRVISSSLCLKDCQSSFDWHLALYNHGGALCPPQMYPPQIDKRTKTDATSSEG